MKNIDMNSINLNVNKDLMFLNTYWKRLKIISEKIKELPNNVKTPLKENKKYKYLKFINYSDITDSWCFKTYSPNLMALSDKIQHMIKKGRSNDVLPMLISIADNTIKKLTWKSGRTNQQGLFLGYGHFRWNYRAYILNKYDLETLKKWINGNI